MRAHIVVDGEDIVRLVSIVGQAVKTEDFDDSATHALILRCRAASAAAQLNRRKTLTVRVQA